MDFVTVCRNVELSTIRCACVRVPGSETDGPRGAGLFTICTQSTDRQTDVRSVAPGSVAISVDLAPRYPTITDNVMLLTLTDNTVLDL